MKNTFLKACLVILAMAPIVLAAKDPSYIPLASTITPVAIGGICELSKEHKLLSDSKQEDNLTQ